MNRFQNRKASIILASGNEEARQLFAGRTLDEVGYLNGLGDSDVKFGWSTNPKNGQEIPSLLIAIKDTKYSIPLSRKFNMDRRTDAEWLLKCEFRAGYKAVVNSDGTPMTKKVDGKDVAVLANGEDGTELQPYMTFGNPSGLTIEREEDAFAPMTEEEIARAKASLAKEPA